MTTLTPEAKALLSSTIRGLRARVLQDIHDEADRAYRLSVPLAQAGLDETHAKRRMRLEAWLDEGVRAAGSQNQKDLAASRARLLAQCELEAAATLLNRLVLVRHLEALGLSKPEILTGGWNSKGYREFREFAPGLADDETEGFATLLGFLFDELAVELPGLFGDVGLTRLFSIPASALREVVERLDDVALESAWADDTTLGWVYQYWNDPERERLDASLDAQQKLRPGDIAPKTQVFTERYMVEWLLQNSLGPTWLCVCRKNGWVADLERVLPALEQRRASWRKKRSAGEVGPDVPMPLDSELERRWQYYVPRALGNDEVERAPRSIREVRLLDPACGSGHFLVIAFDLLVACYQEEARHRGEQLSDRETAESILADNLYGIDLDPRAVQIAEAALVLKAKALAPDARPRRLNLVAPAFRLSSLAKTDPALVTLREELKREMGLSEELTDKVVTSLAGADVWGSLLKVDAAVEDAIRSQEAGWRQPSLGRGPAPPPVCADAFCHAGSDQRERRGGSPSLEGGPAPSLGRGPAPRFLNITRPGFYTHVVGNPPYFGTQALADSAYIDRWYPDSKENLCTVMLDRARELLQPGGRLAFVTVRNWLYLSQFTNFRTTMMHAAPPLVVADLGLGGFESLPGVECVLWIAGASSADSCVVHRITDTAAAAKAVSLTLLDGAFITRPSLLARLPGCPFVYRWSTEFVESFLGLQLVGDVAPVRVGMKTSDNLRFVRKPWELPITEVKAAVVGTFGSGWLPYVKGAAGKSWVEPLSDLVNWGNHGLEVRIALDAAYGQPPQGEKHFLKRGVAFSTIGRSFIARAHRYASIIDVAGSSVFPPDVAAMVCLLNSRFAREVVQELNPTINFQVGDVARIPYKPDPLSAEIFQRVEHAYAEHEAGDELSVAFQRPAPSTWRSAQQWAQAAVDRPDGATLPAFLPAVDEPTGESLLSFALGVALGRFDANGAGVLPDASEDALPDGILFLSRAGGPDGLGHAACAALRSAWDAAWPAKATVADLRAHLCESFFQAHRELYENRPIYLPLSSRKRVFVAYVSIHRWTAATLTTLLAEHLMPEKRRLDGELEDLRQAQPAGKRSRDGERRIEATQKALDELSEFIAAVQELAESGPPAPDGQTPKREASARFAMHLRDGVAVNAAALWPVLHPQWTEPKKWWKQLATRSGPKGKHFDWSATAARYFPARVAGQCKTDPVLASAHGLLWELHPREAYAWELRLRRDGRDEFRIDEPGAAAARELFLSLQHHVAREVEHAESKRRPRRAEPLLERQEGNDD